MEIFEFVGKMAEQHANLLKIIELQNTSIQTLSQRLNALVASQMVVFSLLLEDGHAQRGKIARHLRMMLDNPQITSSPYLVAQLQELLEICESSAPPAAACAPPEKPAPAWLKGVVQGGRAPCPGKEK